MAEPVDEILGAGGVDERVQRFKCRADERAQRASLRAHLLRATGADVSS